MQKKMKLAGIGSCACFSLGTVVALLIDISIPLKSYLWWLLCWTLIVNMSAAFVFKEGVGPKSLWIRRAVIMIITMVSFIVTRWLFGYIDDMRVLVINILALLICFPICTVFIYYLVDKAEKRYLQRINDKLQQMNSDE